jgi:hypothetical protein
MPPQTKYYIMLRPQFLRAQFFKLKKVEEISKKVEEISTFPLPNATRPATLVMGMGRVRAL